MKMKHRLGALNIQLFAEGGAVGEGAGVGDSQQSSGEEKATVVYGKQPQDSSDAGEKRIGEKTVSDTSEIFAEGRRTDIANRGDNRDGADNRSDVTLDGIFEKYPELKKEADERTNKAVQGRVYKLNKALQKNDAVLQKLMVRHGVENIEELDKALDSDEAFEAMAAERGETPETLRELEKLKVFKRMFEEQTRQAEIERKADETYKGWMREAEPLKASYPDFDLNVELQNADFRRLLQSNIPMEHAYKLIHHDELVKAAETAAAEKISKSVQTRAARPSENGLGNQSGVVVKSDVSKLTKKDRADIARRAARGEHIEF